MRLSPRLVTLNLATVFLAASPAAAVIPYSPVPAPGPPVVGPGLSAPPEVYGKEYSHDLDFSVLGPTLDPQQVIAWDGMGGTADAVDYTGTRPDWERDQEVDALANSRDALFDETVRDEAHLVFSHDDLIAAYGVAGGGGPALVPVPSGGPIFLSNGNAIGGAGEVSYELAGMFAPPITQGVWAKQPDVNGMPLPNDVDGLEVWGPEPRREVEPGAPVVSDADKYSLDVDLPSGVSVWNASGSPYISWPTIVASVESLLGPAPPTAFSLRDEHQGRQAINLDALMVSDIIEEKDVFHRDVAIFEGGADDLVDQNGEPIEPFGPDGAERGDAIIFSIRQIVDPADPDGYYATGSELFVLDSLGGVSFLTHGGHLWDHAYALGALGFVGFGDEQNDFRGIIDINAIEAIGEGIFTPPVGLPGDFNGDGKVDAVDYAVWRENLGTGFVLAGNGDETGASMGIVDTADFKLWVDNYGAMAAPSPIITAAPEPATALLMLLATTLSIATTRRTK